MTPYRHTTIAVDFDRTFTSDIEMWRCVIRLFAKRGHTVLCVTGRTESPYSRLEMATIFGEATFKLFKDIIFCNHSPKRDATKRRGYYVDIWIDDLPEGVGATDRKVFRQLEDMCHVCEDLPVFKKKAVHPTRIWTP
jgi:hypothetical protein